MTLGVAVLGAIAPRSLGRIGAQHRLLLHQEMPDLDAFAEAAPEVEVVIIRSPHRLSRAMIDACPRLCAVIRAGTGVDNIDLSALRERGIDLSTTPQSAPAVAELAIGMLLALVRRIVDLHAAVAAGGWPKWQTLGTELQGRRLGVLGYGDVGRRVCRLGAAFGMTVAAHNGPNRPANAEVPIVSFDELLGASEALVLALPLKPETQGLISRHVLARVRPGMILVNVARGPLIDTEALLDALDEGRVRGAGLDTVAEEPALPARLRAHPRVLLTPHIGAQTEETQERVGRAVEEILAKVTRRSNG